MSRRGEGQFVAAKTGLVHDVKIRGIARALKVTRPHAAMTVLLWEEFVLLNGSPVKGAGPAWAVKGFSAAEVAEALEWEGPPRRVLGALKVAGFTRVARGSFIHPFWSETITGNYALRRAKGRDYDKERGRERGTPPDSDRDPDGSGRVPNGSHSGSGDQSTNGSGRTPPGAPQGGAPDVASRLGWFEENYPKGLADTEFCDAQLRALSPDQWDHLQYTVKKKSLSMWWRERGRAPNPERFLKNREWVREKRPKRPSKPPPDPQAEERREEQERDAAARTETWKKRDGIRARLKAEGVPGHELEQRIDAELAKELPS